MSRRVLAIHAHPDDVDIFAGGTLALLAQAGHQVTVATMTAGDCGSAEYGADEIARMRKVEAAQAAAVIGARYFWLGFKDLAIFNDDASRRRVTAALRNLRPEIVLTASPADYHCDHEAASRLVTDACFGASAPNYDCGDPAPALDAIPHLYYMDPAEGNDREGNPLWPGFLVDVGSVMETKRAMVRAHASQAAWLRKQHGMTDFVGTVEAWTRARGALAGCEWAEGFRAYAGHAFPRTPLLESLLGEAVRRADTA